MKTDQLKFSPEAKLEHLDMEFGDLEENLETGISYGKFSFLNIIKQAEKIIADFNKILAGEKNGRLKKEYASRQKSMQTILKNAKTKSKAEG